MSLYKAGWLGTERRQEWLAWIRNGQFYPARHQPVKNQDMGDTKNNFFPVQNFFLWFINYKLIYIQEDRQFYSNGRLFNQNQKKRQEMFFALSILYFNYCKFKFKYARDKILLAIKYFCPWWWAIKCARGAILSTLLRWCALFLRRVARVHEKELTLSTNERVFKVNIAQ